MIFKNVFKVGDFEQIILIFIKSIHHINTSSIKKNNNNNNTIQK